MRYLYTLLICLALPFIFLRLLWKSRKLPAYRMRMAERIGIYSQSLNKSIWIHTVSVGETLAAVPLVKSLQTKYPTLPIVMTTMTPTGAEQVKKSFGDSVIHAYIPYDLPNAAKRFLKTFYPVIAIIIETEMWPNMFAACHQSDIPVCLMNARLSEKSAAGYQKVATLTREMLQHVAVIAAHGNEDAKRFVALGAANVVVTGNIKFDIVLPQDIATHSAALRNSLGNDRFVWLAASTHEGEEKQVLAAHKKLLEKNPNALLILVPRHPERFNDVAKICEQSFKMARRSLNESCEAETTVYLGDSMGELLQLYGVADVVFVGGSLIPRGGHNMLEPAALGKPILTGPYLFNFHEISKLFFAKNAMKQVQNENDLVNELIELQDRDKRAVLSERALKVLAENRGALVKQVELIAGYIS